MVLLGGVLGRSVLRRVEGVRPVCAVHPKASTRFVEMSSLAFGFSPLACVHRYDHPDARKGPHAAGRRPRRRPRHPYGLLAYDGEYDRLLTVRAFSDERAGQIGAEELDAGGHLGRRCRHGLRKLKPI